MNKITFLLILTSFLFGCSPNEVDHNLVQDRSGLAYLPNESEPFTGKAVSSYPSGQQKKVSSYEKGKLTGISYEWYANGQLKTEQHFSGEDEGRIRNWYENGEVARDIRILDGVFMGKNIWKSKGFKSEINVSNGLANGDMSYEYEGVSEQNVYEKGLLKYLKITALDEDRDFFSESRYEHRQDGTETRLKAFEKRFEYKSGNRIEEAKLESEESKIITTTFEKKEYDKEFSVTTSEEINDWKDASPLEIYPDLENEKFIWQQKGIFIPHNIITGKRNGRSWYVSDETIISFDYHEEKPNGSLYFDRKKAKWDGNCYIYNGLTNECEELFDEQKILNYPDIPEQIKTIIKDDQNKAAQKLEVEKRKKQEAERKRKEAEKRKRQQAEEKRKLEAEKRKKLEAEKKRQLEAEKKKLVTAELEKIKNSEKIKFSNSELTTDSDFIPVYVPHPKYPRRAQTRGIMGYAVIQVTITTTGGVRDPVLIEESPEGWGFGRSALKAANKLKYNPRVVDGVPQEVTGVLYKFSFRMAQ